MKAVETTKRNRIGSTVHYSMLGNQLDLSSLIEFGVIVWFSLYECFMMQVGLCLDFGFAHGSNDKKLVTV